MIPRNRYISNEEKPILSCNQEARSTVYFRGSFDEFVEKLAEEGFVLKQSQNDSLYFFRGYTPTLKSFWIMAIEKEEGLLLNTSVNALSHLQARNILV